MVLNKAHYKKGNQIINECTMKLCYQVAIFLSIFMLCDCLHNCTSFDDKNHGFGCELKSVRLEDQPDFEINVMSKEATNKTDADVIWVQIRDSSFKNDLPKGVFEKFINMDRIMILNSMGFKNLEKPYFDKKITLVLMKNTDLETIGENCFMGLENLKTLSLNYNQVKKVHKKAFRDLVAVTKIEIVNNKIEYLDDDVFANNLNLKMLLVYANQIKVVTAALFSRNPNLESIQFQNNQIVQIEKGFYTPLSKLTRADFTGNLCISELLLPTRYVQWSSYTYKLKDCYNNYALMKSTNDVIISVQSKNDELEKNMNATLERVDNDLKIMEGKLDNQTDFDNVKTNLMQFFENDKKSYEKRYEDELTNITSHVRIEMQDEIEKNLAKVLNQSQVTQQEKLVSNDFDTFRGEFKGRFNFVYFTLFLLACLVAFTTFVVTRSVDVKSAFSRQQADTRHLIEAEHY